MSNRRIVVEFIGEDKNLGRTVNDVDSKTSKLGGRLKSFGKVAATGFAVAGAAAVAGGKYMFDLGSKLEQMGMKAETVFGSQLGSVERWSKANAHAMGLTTREATGLAANFADLLIPMGFTRKQAAGMSTDVVGLSGALSQWSGGTVSAAEASDVLAKAMLGETDGLKALGISISAAEIEAELLRKGQDKLTGSARAQAEAQATQALIMAKSKDAQAAFAKGGSPLLTAQAKIKASLGEVRDEIAVRLIPVFASLASWFVDKALPAMKRFGGYLSATLPPIFAKIRAVVRKVFGGMEGDASGSLGMIMDIIKGFVGLVRAVWNRFGTHIITIVKVMFETIVERIKAALQIIRGIIKVVTGIIKGDWKMVWSGIKDIFQGVWRSITALIKQSLTIMVTLFKVAFDIVKGVVRAAWSGIKSLVSNGAAAVVNVVKAIPGKMRALGSLFGDAGRAVIGAFVDGLKNAGGVISGIAGNVWNAVKSLLNGAIAKINAALEFKISLPGPDVTINPPNIPYLATGTRNFRGGLAIVGERGPELVNLPRGSDVFSNAQSRAMAGAGGGNVTVILQLDGREIHRSLLKRKRDLNGTLGLA